MQKKLVPDVIAECRCTTFSPDKSVRAAAALMTEENIGALVIVEGDRVVGIMTERDVLQKIVACDLDPDDTLVRDVMTPNPDTVTGDCRAAQALQMMNSKGYRHLPILTDDGKPCGMVSVRDLYQAVQDALAEELEAVENYVHGGEGYGVGA
ncbi:MAG: CBS domain-containing protein [Methylocystaceae bacterium]|nr:CBS domain-containing protein [Methylocystaceae bacterium]